ncbi:MAG: SRPBCC family protein [Planctomycetaceae bacterium]|nr:SRPBCC family protein [Planctomycetaceae bacterium]
MSNDPAASTSEPTPSHPPKERPVWLQMVMGLVMAIVGLLVVALLISFLLPSTYTVTRSIVIDAPPAEIHPYIETLNQWPEWTTWNTERFPELVYSYEGPEAGVGAIQKWTDPEMGSGRLEITESSEADGIRFTLLFEQSPEPLTGSIVYAATDGGGTRVTWIGNGDVGSNPVARYFGLMMDSMIGVDYEAGLCKLKILVEAPHAE